MAAALTDTTFYTHEDGTMGPSDYRASSTALHTDAVNAERRLWGSMAAHTRVARQGMGTPVTGSRRTMAVGYAGSAGIMVADGPHPDMPAVKGYNYYPAAR